ASRSASSSPRSRTLRRSPEGRLSNGRGLAFAGIAGNRRDPDEPRGGSGGRRSGIGKEEDVAACKRASTPVHCAAIESAEGSITFRRRPWDRRRSWLF